MTMRPVSCGFTLVEVLVALLVFSLIATAAFDVGSQYISTYESVRNKSLASWIAENRLTEVYLMEEPPGLSEETSELKYATYEWEVLTEVKETENEDIRRVDVTVSRVFENQREPRPIHTLSGFLRVAQEGTPQQQETSPQGVPQP